MFSKSWGGHSPQFKAVNEVEKARRKGFFVDGRPKISLFEGQSFGDN